MEASETLEKIEEVLKIFTVLYLIIFDLEDSKDKDYTKIKNIFEKYGKLYDIKLDSTFILQTTANITISILSEDAYHSGISRFMIVEITNKKIRYKNIFDNKTGRPVGL